MNFERLENRRDLTAFHSTTASGQTFNTCNKIEIEIKRNNIYEFFLPPPIQASAPQPARPQPPPQKSRSPPRSQNPIEHSKPAYGLFDVYPRCATVKLNMSARKLVNSSFLIPFTVQAQTTRLELSSNAVRIRKNGIEFQSETAFDTWTEMTVDLETPLSARKLQCTGVVVDCQGNRHQGYRVSMIFIDLSPQSQARLEALATPSLA
jgi:hypothetical protein